MPRSRNLRYLNAGPAMRSSLFLGTAAMIGVLASPLAATAADAPLRSRQAVSAASDAYDAHDCGKVATILAPVLAAPQTAGAKDVADAYDLLVRCALNAEDLPRAADLAHRAIALPEASDYA